MTSGTNRSLSAFLQAANRSLCEERTISQNLEIDNKFNGKTLNRLSVLPFSVKPMDRQVPFDNRSRWAFNISRIVPAAPMLIRHLPLSIAHLGHAGVAIDDISLRGCPFTSASHCKRRFP
jgi:hypothetical protein